MKTGNNLQSEALQETQVKTHFRIPSLTHDSSNVFPLDHSTGVIFGEIPENFVMLSASQKKRLSL